jgi:hypothetical protein
MIDPQLKNDTNSDIDMFYNNDKNLEQFMNIKSREDGKLFIMSVEPLYNIYVLPDNKKIEEGNLPFEMDFKKHLIIFNLEMKQIIKKIFFKTNNKRKRDDDGNMIVKRKKLDNCIDLKVVLPDYWELQKDNFNTYLVDETSNEFKRVVKDIVAEMVHYDFKIDKLMRVQNLNLFKYYSLKMKDVQEKWGEDNVEKILYHGTRFVDSVITEGLDPSYAKSSGAMGKGVYYSKSPITAVHYTNLDDDILQLLICRVIIGKHEKGKKNLTKAPFYKNSNVRADSAKGELGHDKTYAVYDTYQSYPEYILYFKMDKTKIVIPNNNATQQTVQQNTVQNMPFAQNLSFSQNIQNMPLAQNMFQNGQNIPYLQNMTFNNYLSKTPFQYNPYYQTMDASREYYSNIEKYNKNQSMMNQTMINQTISLI